MKKFNEFINESVDYFKITNRYPLDEEDENSSDLIDGVIEYKGHQIVFNVEYHDDFGYSINELNSDDEEFIDDNYDDIKSEIIKNINNTSLREEPESTDQWIVVDIRNRKVLGKRKSPIDRGWASEFYDVPKSFIDIKKI